MKSATYILDQKKITDVYAGNDKVKSGQQELPWTQPVLSANGTIGGDSFIENKRKN